MRSLSSRIGNRVLLKREDLQPVFSFKLRGAYNKMQQLPRAALERGVVAASAGNHAQGLALAAAHMGVKASIVMPRTTPAIKVDAVKARGAKVILHGDTYDEASAHAYALAREKKLTMVPPYDDPEVIAGQGTIAREILEKVGDGALDVVFVPVGASAALSAPEHAHSNQISAELPSLRPRTVTDRPTPSNTLALRAAKHAAVSRPPHPCRYHRARLTVRASTTAA